MRTLNSKKVFALLLLITLLTMVFVGCSKEIIEQPKTEWFSGSGAPIDDWGKDGDVYMDTKLSELYYKSQGSWHKIANVQGDVGQNGTDGVVGQDGQLIKFAQIKDDGHLELTLSSGRTVDVGEVGPTAMFDIDIQGTRLMVTSAVTYESMDSVAYENKSFRDIFLKGNLLAKGNMIDDASIADGWKTSFGEVIVDNADFTTAPTSLFISGTSANQLQREVESTKGNVMFIASQTKVVSYVSGYAGLMVMQSGRVDYSTALNGVTTKFKTLSGTFTCEGKEFDLHLGTSSQSSLTAYVDSLVLVDLTQTFTQIPSKEKMQELYEVFIKLYNGETNVVSEQSFMADSDSSGLSKITDEQAIDAFLRVANQKAKKFGMKNTTITSASGLAHTNVSTAQDLVLLGMQAIGYDQLALIWNRPSYTVKTTGTERSMDITSTVVSGKYSSYLTDYYYVLGGKTGSLVNSTHNVNVKNLLVVAEGTNGAVYVAVVSLDNLTESETNNRFTQMKILLDIADALHQNPSADVSALEAQLTADRASVCVMPSSAHVFGFESYDWFGENSRYHLYSKNGTEQMPTASVTKVLTILVALDRIENINDKITIKSSDILSGSGPIFIGGEQITYRDAFNLMMLPSSNTTAQALARVTGQEVLLLGI